MRKQLIEPAAFDVAEQIRTVEATIDNALAEIAELQGRMMRASLVAGVGVRTGHNALEHLSAALSGLVTARGGMGHCHAALLEATHLVPGLRTVGFGGMTECPKASAGDLRIVA